MNKTLQNEKSMPQVFYAKHMKAGVANYPENKEVIYISNDTIADMAKSFEGKPVYVHHQEVDLENLKDQLDGVVAESFWNKYDGEWWIKFVAISDDAKKAIANGWGVSNCYDHLVRGNGGTCINVKYDSEIIGGQFQHLAIVPNPRYEDAKIYTEEEYNNYIEQKKQKLDKITNSKGENNMKILNEADVKDLLLSKDSKITVGEAIEVLMNSKKVIDQEAEIMLANGEKISVSELINACKKNEDKEEEKENEDKEEEKDFAEGVDYGEKKEKEESKKLDKEHESEGEKKHIEEEKKEEENACKKNSSALRNAYHTACLNNSKSELQEQADRICDSIFNGIERAKELGI